MSLIQERGTVRNRSRPKFKKTPQRDPTPEQKSRPPLPTQKPLHPDLQEEYSRAVKELVELVMIVARKTCTEKNMSLVHVLNSMDSVTDQMETKPAPNVANAVYRELLKNSREKTFESIQTISTEIANMQDQDYRTSSLTRVHTANFEQNLVGELTASEDQSQSAHSQRHAEVRGFLFNSSKANTPTAQNTSAFLSPKLNQQMCTVQIIEEVMGMQRFDTFIRRCRIMEQILVPAPVSKPTKHQSRLPQLKLNSDDTSSSEELYFNSDRNQKVLDTNKVLVIAYYVRKLLFKGLKSLQAMVFERKARTFVITVCKQTYIRNTLRKCLNAFSKYRLLHNQHSLKNLMAAMRYRDSLSRKFMRRWHKAFITNLRETNLLVAARAQLIKSQKRRLLQGWHDAMVDLKMSKMQLNTAQYMHRRKTLLKSFHSLRSYGRYSVKHRTNELKCLNANSQRLQIMGWKALTLFLGRRINKNRNFWLANQNSKQNLQKTALKSLKTWISYKQQIANVKQFCYRFRESILIKKSFAGLLDFTRKQALLKGQQLAVSLMYQKQLKVKMIKMVHETNLEFIRFAVHVEQAMERRRVRKVLSCLKMYADKRKGQNPSLFTNSQMTMLWLWVSAYKLRVSKVKRLGLQNIQVKAMVKNHVVGCVFEQWALKTKKIHKLKSKQRIRLLSEWFEAWYVWSYKRLRLDKARKVIQNKKKLAVLLQVYKVILQHALTKKFERKGVKDFRKALVERQIRTSFYVWHKKYQRILIATQQKQISLKLYKGRWLNKFFTLWHKVFKHKNNLARLDQLKATFLKKKFVQKSFQIWLALFQARFSDCRNSKLAQSHRVRRVKNALFQQLKIEWRQGVDHKNQLGQVLDFKNRFKKNKVFRAWKTYVQGEMHTKNTLYNQLRLEYTSKVRINCFRALYCYLAFKKTQRSKDSLMTRCIVIKKIRKFFLPWNRVANLKVASKHFAHILPRIQLSQSFKLLKHNSDVVEKYRHSVEFVQKQNLVAKTWNALARFAKRHETELKIQETIRQNSDYFAKLNYFRILSGPVTKRSKLLSDSKKLIIVYSRFLKQQVISLLRANVKARNATLIIAARRLERLKARVVSALQWNKNLKDLERQLVIQKQITIKSRIFVDWYQIKNQLEFVREFHVQSDIKKRFQVLSAWRNCVSRRKINSLKVTQGLSNINFFRMRFAILKLYNYCQVQREHRSKLINFQKVQNKRKLKMCFDQVGTYLLSKSSLHKAQKGLVDKKNRQIAVTIIGEWHKQSRVRIQKYKQLVVLLGINQEVLRRQAIAVWGGFTQYCIQVNQTASQYLKDKQGSLCRNVLDVLQNYALKKKGDRARVQFLKEFLVRRLKIRTFAKIYRVKIDRIESDNLDNKVTWFRDTNLIVKGMRSIYTNRLFQVQSRQRIKICQQNRLMPRAVAAWKVYTRHRLQNKLLTLRERGFRFRKLAQAFWHQIMIFHSQKQMKRSVNDQADAIWQKRKLHFFLSQWVQRTCQHQQLSQKRLKLHKAITQVDLEHRRLAAFHYLRLGVLMSQQVELKVIVNYKQMQLAKAFTSWIEVNKNRRRNQQMGRLIQLKREQLQRAEMFTRWFSQINKSLKVHVFVQSHEQRLRQKVLTVLKIAVERGQIKHFVQIHYNANLLRRTICVMQQFKANQEQAREFQSQIQLSLYEKITTKCWLAFKYNVVLGKGHRLIVRKRNALLLLKSFEAFKYDLAQKRLCKDYQQFKTKKLAHKLLLIWLQRTEKQIKVKHSLLPLIRAKHHHRLQLGFNAWRKNCFFGLMLQLIGQHMVIPNQKRLKRQVIFEWRKIAYIKRHGVYQAKDLQLARDQSVKKRILKLWYEKLMQRLPVRVLIEKLDILNKKVQLRQAWQAIATGAAYRSQLYHKSAQISEWRTLSRAATCFKKWRRHFLGNQNTRKIEERLRKKKLKSALGVWLQEYIKIKRARREESALAQKEQITQQYYKKILLTKSIKALSYFASVQRKINQAAQQQTKKSKQKAFGALKQYLAKLEQYGHKKIHQKGAWLCQTRKAKLAQCIMVQWHDYSAKQTQLARACALLIVRRDKQIKSAVFDHLKLQLRPDLGLEEVASKSMVRKQRRKRLAIFQKWRQYKNYKQVTLFNHSRQQNRLITDQLNDEALELRCNRLCFKAFKALKSAAFYEEQENKEEAYRNIRSRMYTLFSAWKFYTKERVLLKRYLVECGQKDLDMSLMSTVEMRQTAEMINTSTISEKKKINKLKGGSVISDIVAKLSQESYSDVNLQNIMQMTGTLSSDD